MEILYYIALIVWIIPAFRNYKTNLFVFFLLLAVHDPLSILFKLLINPHLDLIYSVVITFLIILSLIRVKRKQILLICSISAIILCYLAFIFLSVHTKMLILMMQLVFVFLIILKKFAEYSIVNRAYNIFYIIVIFYLLTLILKFLTVFIGSDYAIEYFIITTVFQILFGLFFSIFREDDPRLLVKFE